MSKLKIFFVRLGFYLSLRLRVYSTWSRIHRLLFDSVAKGARLPTFKDFEEMVPFVRGFVWRPDSWIDLGDAICTPEMVWWRHLNTVDHKVGDCDEFAAFNSNVIANSIKAGVWRSPVKDPQFLTVGWLTAEGKASGHNVCLLNDGNGRFGYMDYGMPAFFGTKQQVVDAIRECYAGPGNVAAAWGVMTPGLAFVEAHWGE